MEAKEIYYDAILNYQAALEYKSGNLSLNYKIAEDYKKLGEDEKYELQNAMFQRYMKRWSRKKQDFAWPAEYGQKASQYPTMKQLTEEAYLEQQKKMESYDDI